MSGRLGVAALGLLVAACGGDGDAEPTATPTPEPSGTPEATPEPTDSPILAPGLRPVARAFFGEAVESPPQLSELVVLPSGEVVAGNSDAGYAIFAASPEGISLVRPRPDGASLPRCATLAFHEGTQSLYCAAPDGSPLVGGPSGDRILAAYDLSDPSNPQVREQGGLLSRWARPRDMVVIGNTVYIAAMDDGLLTIPINDDGTLGDINETRMGGSALRVARAGSRIVVTDRDQGLRLFEIDGVQVRQLDTQPLDGPGLALAANAGRAVAGLGSQGIVVYTIQAGAMQREHFVQPRCVVASLALRDALLAVGCTSGYQLWDLDDAGGEPRPIAFHPGLATAVDVAFVDGADGLELWASDAQDLLRFTVDPEGEVVMPEMPRGLYTAAGEELTLQLGNPSTLALDIEVLLDPEEDGDAPNQSYRTLSIAAGTGTTLRIPWADVQAWLPPMGPGLVLQIRSAQAGERYPFFSGEAGVPIAVRDVEQLEDAAAAPAPGQAFPTLELEDPDAGRVQIAPGDTARLVSFYDPARIAAWAQVDDLSWLERNGRLADREPLLLSQGAADGQRYFRVNWRLDMLSTGYFGRGIGGIVDGDGNVNSLEGGMYERAFIVDAIAPGQSFPTDYRVSAEGRVESVERVYRGLWPLSAWPRE